MKVDAKALKESVMSPKDRKRDTVALYVDIGLWDAFKKACAPASHGKILERFMRDFVESAKGKK